MNVATGRSVFSLLSKGMGSRAGTGAAFTTRDFLGGFNLSRSEEKQQTAPTTSSLDLSRRFLNTRALAARRRGGRGKKNLVTTPTMEIAMEMPKSCKEMNNSDLVMLGALKNPEARKEILIRHIMTVDKVNYEVAEDIFKDIAEKNKEGMWLLTLPYKVGIGMAVTAAAGSFPMVFDINTVTWFNEFYVTADVPEPKDLETPLEVGSWAWNWMEPPLGQISFVLLCLQYTRAQIANIGIRPYTEKMMTVRAKKLAAAFPQYDAKIVADFSEAISLYDEHHGLGN